VIRVSLLLLLLLLLRSNGRVMTASEKFVNATRHDPGPRPSTLPQECVLARGTLVSRGDILGESFPRIVFLPNRDESRNDRTFNIGDRRVFKEISNRLAIRASGNARL